MTANLPDLIQRCLAERQAFYTTRASRSPACVTLFRHAFVGDEAAWQAIFTQVFAKEIRAWVEAAARTGGLSAEDKADAIQDAQLAFYRAAPKAPTLLDSGDLAPILDYLKKCAMSATLRVARKLPPVAVSWAELAGEEPDELASVPSTHRVARLPVQPTLIEEREAMRMLIAEVEKCLDTDLKRLVAQMVFLDDTPPREVLADYSDRFQGDTQVAKLKQLNQILQTVRRCLKQAPGLQMYQSSRRKNIKADFLQFSVHTTLESDEAKMPGSESCPYDDVTLFDYLRGATSAEVRAAIERSPACMAAAAALATDQQGLTPLLRLALCPDPETLIDYHAKRLLGAQQLVIHNHVQRCRQCQTELAMLVAMDDVALVEEPSFLRRLFEAFFLPPTLNAAPVRGALPSVHYRTQIRTPAIDILIFTQKQTGKARTWTLRGELRTEEGLHFTQVEKVVLRGPHPLDASAMVEFSTTLDEEGMFVFRRLEAGDYALQVFTPAEEILIRTLKVGDEQ